jgi:hypothetical protein
VRVVEAGASFVALWLFDALGTPWRARGRAQTPVQVNDDDEQQRQRRGS